MPRPSNIRAGQRFGRLTVLFYGGLKKYSHCYRRIWNCRCDCGGYKVLTTTDLNGGKTKSCGCLGVESRFNVKHHKDLSGNRYGFLTVLSLAGKTNNGHAVWLCVCDCGKMCFYRADMLHYRVVKSCGCKRGGSNRKEDQPHSLKNIKEYNKFRSETLADGVVRNRIIKHLKIKTEDITPETIAIKREQLKLFRLIRKGKELINEHARNGVQGIEANA